MEGRWARSNAYRLIPETSSATTRAQDFEGLPFPGVYCPQTEVSGMVSLGFRGLVYSFLFFAIAEIVCRVSNKSQGWFPLCIEVSGIVSIDLGGLMYCSRKH